MKRTAVFLSFSMTLILFGCTGQSGDSSTSPDAVKKTPTEPAETTTDAPPATGTSQATSANAAITTPDELKATLRKKNPKLTSEIGVEADEQAIRAVQINDPNLEDISPLKGLPLMLLDLRGSRVEDLSPLQGMPLRELYLEDTPVDDISALKGMPLAKLYLSNTKVEDLSPLQGARTLSEVNLVGTKVADLGPLAKSPVRMLWMTGCPISDISPLKTMPLVSVTLADTKVSDLTPLERHPTLERLHIARTNVTDLEPLKWLRLTRLIFTPNRIKQGIDVVRVMDSLQEIDTAFPHPEHERPLPPAAFWQMYDAGALK